MRQSNEGKGRLSACYKLHRRDYFFDTEAEVSAIPAPQTYSSFKAYRLLNMSFGSSRSAQLSRSLSSANMGETM